MNKVFNLFVFCILVSFSSQVFAQGIGSSSLFRNVSPKNGQFVQNQVNLSWTTLDTADNYQLKIFRTIDNSLVHSDFLDSTEVTKNLLSDNYYWKVIALRNGSSIDSTNSNSFSIFSPLDVDSLALWLVGDSGITESNGQISQWNDLSNAGLVLNQTVANNQPTLVQNRLNGHDVVDFDISQDVFSNVVNIDKPNYYITTVYNWEAAATKPTRLITGGSSNWILGPYQKHSLYQGIAFIGTGVDVVKDQFVLNGAHSLNNTLHHVYNGNKISNGAIGRIPGQLSISRANNDYMDGQVAEIVMINGSVDNNRVDSINNYLMDKYAPPVDLGSDQMICSFPYVLDVDEDYYLNYSWSSGSSDSIISINSSGKYYVTVTDIFNRTSIDSVNIIQNIDNYTVSLGADTVLCLGESITIGVEASELFSYSWNTGSSDQTIMVDTNGLYILTVINCLGTVSRDSIRVDFNNPEFSLGADTSICFYNSLTLAPDSNFTSVNYVWSDGSSNPQLNVSSTNTYSLTVTDTYMCQFVDSIQVISDSTLFGVDLGPDTSLCFGNRIGLVNPIANIDSYLWSTGSTDSSIVGTTSQKYYLTITNNGCSVIDSVDIQVKGLAPQAGFDYMNQCFMDSIQFMDTSVANGGINIKSWLWNFGDGDTSINQNPRHYYDTNGVFNVQLRIINDSNCASTVSFPVSIYPKPEADFSFSNFCAEDTIFFTNTTNINSGSITDFSWDFGNTAVTNDTSNIENPKYVYPIDGSYTVQLIVSSNEACIDTVSRSLLIAPSPQPNFSYVNNYVGDSTRFINQSSISSGSINSYNWSFGNSLNSTLDNPKTVYNMLGKYLVSLTANSSLGCSKTFSDSIEITLRPPPVPSFNIVYPKYNQTVEPDITFEWNRADSSDSYSVQFATDSLFQNIISQENKLVTRYYSSTFPEGSFFWRVVAYNSNNPIDTSNVGLFHRIDILGLDSLNLWLSADTGAIDTNGIVSVWNDLSDSSLVLQQFNTGDQPSLISDGLNGHDLVDFGTSKTFFQDFVDITNKNYFISIVYNFHESASRPVRLITGNVSFSNWILGPYQSHSLFNGSSFVSSGMPIVQDRFVVNTAYSINDSLEHIVNEASIGKAAVGNIPRLLSLGNNGNDYFNGSVAEVVMVNGSVSKQKADRVQNYLMDKYAPPVNLGANQIVCTYPNNITAYKDSYINYTWSTGSTDSAIVVDTSGRYYVTVTDIFNRVSVDSMFFILDTFDYQVDFSYNDTTICEGNSLAIWAGESNLTYSWNTNEITPLIQVDSAWMYKVTVTNCLGIASEDSIQLNVNNPVFNLGNDTTICFNNQIELRPDSNFANVTYSWSNGTAADSILINLENNYALRVTDQYNCSFSDTISITVDSSLSGLTLGPDTNLCRGNILGLINPVAGINSYQWSNGLTSPTIVLDSSSNYYVDIVKDGCQVSDTTLVTILGDIPTAGFLNANLCLNDSMSFSDLSSAPMGDTLTQWTWDFGDGNTSSSQSPFHKYNGVSTYQVALNVMTNKGCFNSITQTVEVHPLPVADFVIQNNCSKRNINFIDNSSVTAGSVLGFSWDFGDTMSLSNTSNQQNPTHIFDTLGSYNIQLIAETDIGCRDTVNYTKIVNPTPAVNFSFEGTCLGDTTNFYDLSILPSGKITNYHWGINWLPTPSGNVTSPDSSLQLVIPIAKEVKVSLRVTSDSSCVETMRDTFNINPKPMADFTVGDNCVNADFPVTNMSSIVGDTIVSNQFVFNNTDTSLQENPIFNSSTTGQYPIKLWVESSNGCIDSVEKNIEISELPIPDFRVLNNNTGIPFKLALQNNSSNAQNYIWSFGNGDTLHGVLPNYTYRDTGSYFIQLKAITTKGCVDSISRSINVLPYFLDAAIGEIILSEDFNGYLSVGVQLLNTGNNTIEQVNLVADLNSEFQFQETSTETIYSGDVGGYQFNSSFIQNEGSKVNFVCVKIASVNGVSDDDLSNNYLCEKGFNDNLYLNIFPNPAVEKLNMEYVLPKKGDLRINIYDNQGRRVLQEYNTSEASGIYKIQFNTTDLKSGIYHYEFVFEGTKRSGSFMKQ